MLRKNTREIAFSDDLELTPGTTYFLFVDAAALLLELAIAPNFAQKLEDKIATDTGFAVSVSTIDMGRLAGISAGALVPIRVRVPIGATNGTAETQGGVLLLGVVIAALGAIATYGVLQIKKVEKEILETIPDEAIVKASSGLQMAGLAALVLAVGGVLVALRR